MNGKDCLVKIQSFCKSVFGNSCNEKDFLKLLDEFSSWAIQTIPRATGRRPDLSDCNKLLSAVWHGYYRSFEVFNPKVDLQPKVRSMLYQLAKRSQKDLDRVSQKSVITHLQLCLRLELIDCIDFSHILSILNSSRLSHREVAQLVIIFEKGRISGYENHRTMHNILINLSFDGREDDDYARSMAYIIGFCAREAMIQRGNESIRGYEDLMKKYLSSLDVKTIEKLSPENVALLCSSCITAKKMGVIEGVNNELSKLPFISLSLVPKMKRSQDVMSTIAFAISQIPLQTLSQVDSWRKALIHISSNVSQHNLTLKDISFLMSLICKTRQKQVMKLILPYFWNHPEVTQPFTAVKQVYIISFIYYEYKSLRVLSPSSRLILSHIDTSLAMDNKIASKLEYLQTLTRTS